MSPKLLILIENDSNLRQSIALLLERAGYLVTATDCVYKALDLLSSNPCHLLISDFNIPETRDILLPKVPRIYPHLPIVILTDQSSVEVERQSRMTRAHFLLKPVAPEKLIDSVGTILGNSSNSNCSMNQNVLVDRVKF